MSRRLSHKEQTKLANQKRLQGNTTYEQQWKPKPTKPKDPAKTKTPTGLFTIRHTCGHLVSHNLKSIPPADRAEVKRKIAEDLCKNCILALKRESASRFNADLPQLDGTKDDILDGGRARYYMLPKVKEEIRQQIVSYQIAVQEGTLTQAKAEKMEELLLRAERNMIRQKSGKWWLKMLHELVEPRKVVNYLLYKTIKTDREQREQQRA